MQQISTEFLALSDEAVLLARGNRVEYANPAAKAVLGADCTEKTVSALFGRELSEAQGSGYTADFLLNGAEYTLRMVRADGIRAFYMKKDDLSGILLNDALMFSLQNNLMSLGIASELCRDQVDDLGNAELSRDFAVLTRNSFRLQRTVGNAAFIRRYGQGAVLPQAVKLNLSLLLLELGDTVRLLRRDTRIDLVSGGNICLAADPRLLALLIMNLLSNALVHAAGADHIGIELSQTAKYVYLTVRDNGCGIPPQELTGVFHRFRDRSNPTAIDRGAGLGLSVVRGVSRVHGGTVLLESKEGQGTTVQCSFSRSPLFAVCDNTDIETPFTMQEILVGLSDCLELDCFSGRFMD